MARNRSMQRTRNRSRNRSKRGGAGEDNMTPADKMFDIAKKADNKQEYDKAEQFYRLAAADRKHPEANFELGNIIYTGLGSWKKKPESEKLLEALKLFTLAVEQGKEDDNWMEEAKGTIEFITRRFATEAAAPAGGKSMRRRHHRRHRRRTNKIRKSRKGRKMRRN